jgi:hypothetical protein
VVGFAGKDAGRITSSVVHQGSVVDGGVNGFPWKSGGPETDLPVSNAVFQERSRIEHMCMPNHQDV